MRITINTKNISDVAELQRALRSAAARLDADALTPGADFEVGNVRVQVADTTISDVRTFAHKYGFPVGKRGRYSAALADAWEVYSNAADKRSVVAEIKTRAAQARAAVEAVAV